MLTIIIVITNAELFVLLFVTANTASFMTATICSEYYINAWCDMNSLLIAQHLIFRAISSIIILLKIIILCLTFCLLFIKIINDIIDYFNE